MVRTVSVLRFPEPIPEHKLKPNFELARTLEPSLEPSKPLMRAGLGPSTLGTRMVEQPADQTRRLAALDQLEKESRGVRADPSSLRLYIRDNFASLVAARRRG